MSKRTRKRYTLEFKREAESLVTEHGYSKAEAGRSLDVNPNQALATRMRCNRKRCVLRPE